ARKIGDDWRPETDAPILPASTVHAHTKRLAALGLIDRQVEPATIRRPKRVKGEDGKWVSQRDAQGTGEYEAAVDGVTFLNLPGDTIAEMLTPFAFFADPPDKPKRGGDRRSAKFQAMRAAVQNDPENGSECPHCHEKGTLALTCTACGCRITDEDLKDA